MECKMSLVRGFDMVALSMVYNGATVSAKILPDPLHSRCT